MTLALAGEAATQQRIPAGDAGRAPDTTVPAKRALVSTRLDGWLVGGLGLVMWVVLSDLPWLPTFDVPVLRGVLFWALLGITATHFGVSYHMAYAQPRAELRRHWLSLFAVPALLAAFVVATIVGTAASVPALARGVPRFGLAAVYSLTTWHYVKQTYGVARVGASLNRLAIGARAAAVLRYGLYPLWFLEAVALVWAPGTRINDYGFGAAFRIMPPTVVDWLRVGSLLSAAVVVGTLVLLARRWRRFPPATVWTPYAVAILWILWSPSHVSAIVVFGAVHAMQYLACAHRVELVLARERAEPSRVVWWCAVFGSAFAGGMLLVYWLPMWLGYGGGAQLGVTAAALLFVVFNLHHYAIDAAIWRSRGGHVRRLTR